MIRTWKLTKNTPEEVEFSECTSLDSVTRQLPEGYYSTFRTYEGGTRVLGFSAHLRRLPDIDASFLRRHLNQLLEPYRPGEARVRVMMTAQGQVYAAIEPLKLLPREVYESGVRVETTDIRRDSPRVKSTAFIEKSDDERKHLTQAGIFEALLVKNGRILEGMTSNFFYILLPERTSRLCERSGAQSKRPSSAFVATSAPHFAQGGVLYTARRDILLGVTRRTVIRVARGRGVEVKYSPLKLNQLSALHEAFITSSSRGVVPVVQIDDVAVGQGRAGEITKQLSAAYEAYVIRRAERI